MPTAQWIAANRQITFWLPNAVADDFDAACERASKDKTEVLRGAVAVMLGIPAAETRTGQGVTTEEAEAEGARLRRAEGFSEQPISPDEVGRMAETDTLPDTG